MKDDFENVDELEGSIVMERLAEKDLVDAFYEAVDADDFGAAKVLMRKAGVESAMIAAVMQMLAAQ